MRGRQSGWHQVQPASLQCLSWQSCRWADNQVRIRKSNSTVVKFGKNITKRRTLALRIGGMRCQLPCGGSQEWGVEMEMGQTSRAHAAI